MMRGWIILFALLLVPSMASARDAAFVDPNASAVGRGPTNEALVPEPRELDTGESVVGVSRRTTLFFTNLSALPVTISNINLNFDSNVTAEIVSDDCQKLGKIPSGNRCALAIAVNPNSPGPWTVEVLVTHDGAGRITRALLNGTTLGERRQVQERQMGLAMSATRIEPVDFGEIEVGTDEAVRSALVFNDSAEELTILGIDVIAANNGLERLNQGCELDMTLRTNESCPITLRWAPQSRNNISTDIIVRHTGRTGFMVIPVRGRATGGEALVTTPAVEPKVTASSGVTKAGDLLPPPPSAEIAKLAAAMPPIEAKAVMRETPAASSDSSDIELIGTIGQKVILQRGTTRRVVSVGQSASIGDAEVRVLQVGARQAKVEVNGNERQLSLRKSSPREAVTDSVNSANTGSASSNNSGATTPSMTPPARPAAASNGGAS